MLILEGLIQQLHDMIMIVAGLVTTKKVLPLDYICCQCINKSTRRCNFIAVQMMLLCYLFDQRLCK